MGTGFEHLEQLLAQLWTCELSNALAYCLQCGDATVAGVVDVSLHGNNLLHGSLVRGVHEALSQELVELLLSWCEHVHDDVRPDLAWLVCDLLYHRRECLIDDVEPCPDRQNVSLELIGCQSAIQTLALWECRDLDVC